MKAIEKDDAIIVQLEGKIDTLTSPNIQESILSHIEAGKTKIVLDLSAVNYISSMGLRVFIVIQKKLKQLNSELVICHLNDMLKQIFDVSGFTALFYFSNAIDDAIYYLSSDD